MTNKTYIWQGPATAIELWPEVTPDKTKPDQAEGAKKPLFSGFVMKGLVLELPENHEAVQGWLAFGLIVPAPEPAPQPALEPAPKKKDGANG